MPTAERKRELKLGPVAPWHTTITVWATATDHGRQSSLPHDWLFEVVAEWTGPPAVGMPRSAVPVSSRDSYVLTTLSEATALAHAASEAFGRGGDYPPDLRELATGKPAAEQARAPRFWTPNSCALLRSARRGAI